MVVILQNTILTELGVPFWLTTVIILAMIMLYTYEGGVKTIVWTDTLQTTCMLAGLVICVIYILNTMNISLGESLQRMGEKGYSTIFFTDPDSRYFL